MGKSVFGQVVIGPPGCGKTTYCEAMQKLLKELGRKVVIVNIDPANERRKYAADIDMFELITLEDAMENMKLGPNGGLMYCMEFLEKNLSWLERKISAFQDSYFIFDCPGQTVKSHVPLIKFRKGGPYRENTPSASAPSGGAASSSRPSSGGGPVIEDWQLPPHYRRAPLDDKEIDAINSGGAY